MKSVKVLLNLLKLPFISIIIIVAFYFVNLWLFSSKSFISPTDAFFIEGIFFLIIGFLLLLGSGGINLWSKKAAILSALTGAVYDKDTIGPNEMFRRDRWKPEGFTRLGLILLITGVFMIILYFLIL